MNVLKHIAKVGVAVVCLPALVPLTMVGTAALCSAVVRDFVRNKKYVSAAALAVGSIAAYPLMVSVVLVTTVVRGIDRDSLNFITIKVNSKEDADVLQREIEKNVTNDDFTKKIRVVVK